MNQIAHSTLAAPGAFPEGFLDRVAEGASRRETERELPFEIINELKAQRFGARRLPAAQGGIGARLADNLAAAIDLASADPNVAHIWRNHQILVERLALYPTTHPHLLKLRERVAAGDLFALSSTELNRPQVGGASLFETSLTRSGEGYVLNGTKFYCTGSIFADWISIPATLDGETKVTLVLPRDRDGIETRDDWDGMGQRLTGSGTTVLRDVPVAAGEVLLPDAIPAPRTVFSSTIAQLFLTAVIAGITAAIARDAADLLGRRKRNFYYAPAERAFEDPLLLAALGEREADAFAARATVLAAAAVLDRASDAIRTEAPDVDDRVEHAAAAAAKAKIVVDRLAHHAGSALFDVSGASGTRAALNLDRHWRNIRTISAHNPASHKAYALGNLAINDERLPSLGFF